MGSELIISVSGLRGVVGESLTPEVALRYVAAFAAELPAGSILLTRDGRTWCRMICDLVRGCLTAIGRTVIDAGIAATPTAGVLVRRYQAVGGIQVSASHNPPEYNGLKLFDATGRVISAAAGQKVIDRFREATPIAWRGYQKIGDLIECDDAVTDHLGLVLQTVDVERIRDQGFHVLLDSNHGAGGILGRRLLEHLGCKVTLLGEDPSGKFAHRPEPTAENLEQVARQAAQLRTHVGFCQDPDADRLAVLDEFGNYIGEEYTLAMCLDHVLKTLRGPIVTNCSTSRMSEDLAARYGVPFYRSAVGEANVTGRMQEVNAVFGGEGNGGPIDPRVGYIRDSFVGMALILNELASRPLTISKWVQELPRYAIHKDKVTLGRHRLPSALEALTKHFADAKVDQLDGLRLDWPNRWLLVRASNTEPIVRIIAEAPDATTAATLCQQAADVIAMA